MPRVIATTLIALAAAAPSPAAAPAQAPAAGEPLPRVSLETERAAGPADIPARLRAPGYDGRAAIRWRGQYSRRFPKKSYRVELRGADGRNADAPLLGLPADDDWILYSPYNDRTLMRNVLAYDTARGMGRYAVRTRFVELTVNGDHRGVYVLMESPKLHDARVRAGRGGFLLELTSRRQSPRKDPSFVTPVTRRSVVWDDPERADLSRREAARSRAAVGRAERALYGGRRGAWRRHVDAGAAVDYLLVQELFKNEDAMRVSTFMSGRPGGRVRLGPVWDFDVAMGASRRGPSSVLPGWMAANRPWAEPLYADRAFARALALRWRELRAAGLGERLLAQVDALGTGLAEPAVSDDARWPPRGDRPAGAREAHVAQLRAWLVARIAWLDRHLPGLHRRALPTREAGAR